jgi:hypothetical protein
MAFRSRSKSPMARISSSQSRADGRTRPPLMGRLTGRVEGARQPKSAASARIAIASTRERLDDRSPNARGEALHARDRFIKMLRMRRVLRRGRVSICHRERRECHRDQKRNRSKTARSRAHDPRSMIGRERGRNDARRSWTTMTARVEWFSRGGGLRGCWGFDACAVMAFGIEPRDPLKKNRRGPIGSDLRSNDLRDRDAQAPSPRDNAVRQQSLHSRRR